MKKILVSLSIIFIALLCSISIFASSAVDSRTVKDEGTCGENITWTLYDSGELIIDGSGDMPDFSSYSAPWSSYRSNTYFVAIKEGITSIGENAFYNFKQLKDVEIWNGVISIGFSAFEGCKNLSIIEIPKSVTTIDGEAFNNCTNMEATYYMGSEEDWNKVSIGSLNSKLTNSTKIFVPEGNVLIKYHANEGTGGPYGSSVPANSSDVAIPDAIPQKEAGLFSGWASTKDAIDAEYQPGDLIDVGEEDITLYAVWELGGNCGSNLTWKLEDDGVLIISGTGKMSDFTTDTIPWSALLDDILSVRIEDGVTSIGVQAFRGCSNLVSISIPDSVNTIGNSAFYECSNLLSVKIPDGITTIDNHTFSNCTSLTSVEIPDSVSTIGKHAFSYCFLKSIEIPYGVETINDYAFYYCDFLQEINIPDSVTLIGNYAFAYCNRAKSIKISEIATSIGDYAFGECYDVTNIKIPDSVASIGAGAFRYCRNLLSAKIPDGITNINNYTFYQCSSLKSIEIPDSVTTIGMCAFFKCDELNNILYHGTKKEWNSISIGNDNSPLSKNVEFRERMNLDRVEFSYSKDSLVANLVFAWAKEDATAYFVVYDSNNKMVALGFTDVKKGDTTAAVEISTDVNYNGYQYKILLWNQESILPYTKCNNGTLQY